MILHWLHFQMNKSADLLILLSGNLKSMDFSISIYSNKNARDVLR